MAGTGVARAWTVADGGWTGLRAEDREQVCALLAAPIVVSATELPVPAVPAGPVPPPPGRRRRLPRRGI